MALVVLTPPRKCALLARTVLRKPAPQFHAQLALTPRALASSPLQTATRVLLASSVSRARPRPLASTAANRAIFAPQGRKVQLNTLALLAPSQICLTLLTLNIVQLALLATAALQAHLHLQLVLLAPTLIRAVCARTIVYLVLPERSVRLPALPYP